VRVPIVIGEAYGPFRVLKKLAVATATTGTLYECQCVVCGDVTERFVSEIKNSQKNGQTLCMRCPARKSRRVGEKFGPYEVLERLPRSGTNSRFRVRCGRCGSELVRTGACLRNVVRFSTKGCSQCKNGETESAGKYHQTHPREYTSWQQWRSRCSCPTHPAWKHYGAKGIHVCERWQKSFTAFLDDVGACPEGKVILALLPGRKEVGPGSVVWMDRHEHSVMFPRKKGSDSA